MIDQRQTSFPGPRPQKTLSQWKEFFLSLVEEGRVGEVERSKISFYNFLRERDLWCIYTQLNEFLPQSKKTQEDDFIFGIESLLRGNFYSECIELYRGYLRFIAQKKISPLLAHKKIKKILFNTPLCLARELMSFIVEGETNPGLFSRESQKIKTLILHQEIDEQVKILDYFLRTHPGERVDLPLEKKLKILDRAVKCEFPRVIMALNPLMLKKLPAPSMESSTNAQFHHTKNFSSSQIHLSPKDTRELLEKLQKIFEGAPSSGPDLVLEFAQSNLKNYLRSYSYLSYSQAYDLLLCFYTLGLPSCCDLILDKGKSFGDEDDVYKFLFLENEVRFAKGDYPSVLKNLEILERTVDLGKIQFRNFLSQKEKALRGMDRFTEADDLKRFLDRDPRENTRKSER